MIRIKRCLRGELDIVRFFDEFHLADEIPDVE